MRRSSQSSSSLEDIAPLVDLRKGQGLETRAKLRGENLRQGQDNCKTTHKTRLKTNHEKTIWTQELKGQALNTKARQDKTRR